MNLFSPVYRRLENEIVELSHSIFFDDEQLDTYSLALADIIIRCSVEIEAVAKELYLREGGNPNPTDNEGNQRDLYFDTDCMALLVDRWKLDRKALCITNPNMYFGKDASVIKPLHKSHKRGTSGSKWKRAYQAVKHNRSNSIKLATVTNAINALGALYILNLYYADESFWAETPISGRRNYTNDSQIFTPVVVDATRVDMSPHMVGDLFDCPPEEECDAAIFIQKVTDEALREINRAFCEIELTTIREILDSESFLEASALHPEYAGKPLALMGAYLKADFGKVQRRELGKRGVFNGLRRQEVTLNNHAPVYPELVLDDYLKTDMGSQLMKSLNLTMELFS